MHTIHGLCHLCIGCRLPQVCSDSADQEDISRKTPSRFLGDFFFLVLPPGEEKKSATTPRGWNNGERVSGRVNKLPVSLYYSSFTRRDE